MSRPRNTEPQANGALARALQVMDEGARGAEGSLRRHSCDVHRLQWLDGAGILR